MKVRPTTLYVWVFILYESFDEVDTQLNPILTNYFTPHVMPMVWCPFMVSLTQPIGGVLVQCGGSVITNSLTLTAAHCIKNGFKGLRLRLGSTNLLSGGWLLGATKTILHERFNPATLENDIGLVSIFPAVLTFGSFIQPVRLPKEDIRPLTNNMFLFIFGWGAKSDYESFSVRLRGALIPTVPKELCRVCLNGYLPKNTFCMGYHDGRVDACMGDSGGPVMLGETQLGIISFGEGCALPYKYGVYTDVTKYVGWIKKYINNEPAVLTIKSIVVSANI